MRDKGRIIKGKNLIITFNISLKLYQFFILIFLNEINLVKVVERKSIYGVY